MKAKITYSLSIVKEIIDLEDWGYDGDTKWSDLTEDQQNWITDNLSEQNIVQTSVEEIN